MGQAHNKTPQHLMLPLFTELVGRVTPFALLKVLQQYDLLSAKDLPCHHSLRTSMRLPCHHEIQQRLYEKNILHLSDIHNRWHFAKVPSAHTFVAPEQLLLMNPRVIQSKGCPKKSRLRKESTRREPSAFENEERKEDGRKRRVLRSKK
jgi:hypothetical protein